MLTFIYACAGLFTNIFEVVYDIDFFRILVFLIVVETSLGFYFFINRGVKKS